jgi:hypothetical protein
MERSLLYEYTIWIGAGVYTWLAGLLAVGLLVPTFRSFGLMSVIQGITAFILFLPLKSLYQWRHDLPAKVKAWVQGNKTTLRLAAGFAVLSMVALQMSSTTLNLINIPMRSFAVPLFQMELFYRPIFGGKFAGMLFVVGKTYLQLFWIFILSSMIAWFLNRVRADA